MDDGFDRTVIVRSLTAISIRPIALEAHTTSTRTTMRHSSLNVCCRRLGEVPERGESRPAQKGRYIYGTDRHSIRCCCPHHMNVHNPSSGGRHASS